MPYYPDRKLERLVEKREADLLARVRNPENIVRWLGMRVAGDAHDLKPYVYPVPSHNSEDLNTALSYALDIDPDTRNTAKDLVTSLKALERGRIEFLRAALPRWYRESTPGDHIPAHERHWGHPATPPVSHLILSASEFLASYPAAA